MAETTYKGNCAYRLNPDRGNPQEIAFADEWVEQNKDFTNTAVTTRTLGYLLAKQPASWSLPSPRDEMVAATVIQWLGSNVGFSFLQNALGRCGFQIVKTDRRKHG